MGERLLELKMYDLAIQTFEEAMWYHRLLEDEEAMKELRSFLVVAYQKLDEKAIAAELAQQNQ
jgi:hypothetical protein